MDPLIPLMVVSVALAVGASIWMFVEWLGARRDRKNAARTMDAVDAYLNRNKKRNP